MGETIRQAVAVSKENVSRFDIGIELVTDQTFDRIGAQRDARYRPPPGCSTKSPKSFLTGSIAAERYSTLSSALSVNDPM